MIKFLAKTSLAVILLAWLILDGRLDLVLLLKLFDSPQLLIMGFLFIFSQDILSSLRLLIIINSQKPRSLTWPQSLKLTWIGLFFNTFTPGAVSGDIIKIFYVKKEISQKHNPSSFSFIFNSIALDRIIGLSALVYLGALASFFVHFEIVPYNDKVQELIIANYVIASLFSLGFFVIFFTPKKIQQYTLKICLKIPKLGKILAKQFFYTWPLKDKKFMLTKGLSLSFLSHIFGFIGFWILCSPELTEAQFSFLAFITFVPLGLIILAIPLTPAGIGVGHLAFEGLFLLYGLEGGANYFNIFYLVQILSNSLGVIPYLLYKPSQG